PGQQPFAIFQQRRRHLLVTEALEHRQKRLRQSRLLPRMRRQQVVASSGEQCFDHKVVTSGKWQVTRDKLNDISDIALKTCHLPPATFPMNPEIIGSIAAILTTAAYVPQVVKVLRHKHTKSISLGMYSILT